MKSFVAIVLSIIACTSISAQATAPKLSDLGWLAGCWEMTNSSRGLTITEMWMKPGGDAMIGVGRTVKAGKLVDFEFVRIVEDAGGLAYISRPSANKEDTTFRFLRGTVNELIFENPTHDFPQRVIYKLSGNNLHARIEGTKDGKTRGVDFPYSRVRCD